MNVIEATKQAAKLNTAFYRKDAFVKELVCVVPLKEPFWCLLFLMPFKYLNHRPASSEEWEEIHLCGGWNPTAEDILSEEWEVMELSKVKELIAHGKVIQETWWRKINK